MLDLVTTTQFRKDLKKLRKRGADMQKLDDVLQIEIIEIPNACYDEWSLSLYVLGASSPNTNLNPAIENNSYLAIPFDHNVIEQSAP